MVVDKINEPANNNQFNGMNTNNGIYNNQNFSVQDNNTSQNTNVTTNVYSDNGTNIINDSPVYNKPVTNKKKTVMISSEMKVFMVIIVILFVAIMFLPSIYDLFSKLFNH